MTKKFLDTLVEISFTDNTVNESVTTEIASKLKRRELKAYIRRMRAQLLKHTVEIVTPYDLSQNTHTMLSEKYSDKMVTFQTNRDYLLGAKIINGDIVYDLTLKGEFDQIIDSMKE